MGRKRRFDNKVYEALSPDSVMYQENTYTIHQGVGLTSFFAPFALNDVYRMKLMLSSEGQNSIPMGDTTDHTDRYLLKSTKARIEIRNTNPHPLYLQVWWLVARGDYYVSDSTEYNVSGSEYQADEDSAPGHVMQLLFNGWNNKILAADSSTQIGTFTGGNTSITSETVGLNPFWSQQLCNYYKIIPGKKGWVAAGQTVELHWNTGKYSFNYNKLFAQLPITVAMTTVQLDKFALKNFTVIPLFKWHMSQGHAATTTTSDFMSGHLNMMLYEQARICRIDDIKMNEIIAYGQIRHRTYSGTFTAPSFEFEVADE
jgi:hypothetical protein